MASRVVYKPGAVRTFATTQARKDVRKTATEIKNLSKKTLGRGPYSTGALGASIHQDGPQTAGWYIRSRVGSPLDYAIYVHEGTKPHVIRGRGGKNLSFWWRKRGVLFRGPKVNHPGQEDNPFLTVPLLLVAPRRGYAVRIYR